MGQYVKCKTRLRLLKQILLYQKQNIIFVISFQGTHSGIKPFITYWKMYLHLILAIFVISFETSSEVFNHLPCKCEECIVIGVLCDLQVLEHQAAEVFRVQLSKDLRGKKLPQIQAIFQEETDKFGPVFH